MLILVFSAIALVAFTAERLLPARPQPVLRRGLTTDGLYVAVNVALRVVFTNWLAVAFTELGRQILPAGATDLLRGQPLWLQAVAIVFVLDLIAYWLHRAKHRWHWLWRLHESHHSSVDLDWFSSVRFHPLEKVLDRVLYLFPLTLLGASEPALLILAAVDAGVASLAHANVRLRFGPLRYLVVGPEMHHWHHAADASGQRSNYGNNLAVFDWLFGTAHVPSELPKRYGLGDAAYPEGNILRQFLYAFRPREIVRRDDDES